MNRTAARRALPAASAPGSEPGPRRARNRRTPVRRANPRPPGSRARSPRRGSRSPGGHIPSLLREVPKVRPSNRSGVCTVCPARRNSSANATTPGVNPCEWWKSTTSAIVTSGSGRKKRGWRRWTALIPALPVLPAPKHRAWPRARLVKPSLARPTAGRDAAAVASWAWTAARKATRGICPRDDLSLGLGTCGCGPACAARASQGRARR